MSFSSINDGIGDVWKDYYGFSLSDPELAAADYNGTGVTNLVKYLANLWPLDTPPPQIQPQPKPAPVKKSATPSAKAATSPADAPSNLIKGGSFSGVDHALPNQQSKGYLGGGFDWGFVPEDKVSGGWKALKGDKIEVWKTDDGKQFVELNANAANSGIEQKVTGIQPGTYVLTWRDMGRESANADGSNYSAFVFTKKKTQDTADEGKNAGALEGRTDILKPPYQTAGKWGDWKTKVVVFTVSAEDLKNNNLWIAFKPRDEARTYGALIDDVILTPVEIVKPELDGQGNVAMDSHGNVTLAPVTELKVADMEDSLGIDNQIHIEKTFLKDLPAGVGPRVDNPGDKDRFYVRLNNLGGAKNVSVKLGTVENPMTEYNEDAAWVDLKEENGSFLSEAQLLVSDKVDKINAQTHLIQLDGKMRVSAIKIDGKESPADFKIPVPAKKTVTINVVVMTDAQAPDVADEVKMTNERYASAGIRVVLGSSVPKPPPPRLSSSPEGSIVDAKDVADRGRYMSHYGTDSKIDDIHVFYVKKVSWGTVQARGVAIHESLPGTVNGTDTPTAADVGDANNIFVGDNHAPFRTLAHELGHVLTNRGHYTDRIPAKQEHNLMLDRGNNRTVNSLGASKRLYESQKKVMWNHTSLVK